MHAYCVVLPAFNEADHIGAVIKNVRKQPVDVVVIDDGSTDETVAVSEAAGAVVIKHERNLGKGAALESGFDYAMLHLYEGLITMDADGQHDPEDIPCFIDAFQRTGISVLIGNRMADVSAMPVIRRLTNHFMSWLLGRHMRQYIPDSQNGFRLYQADILPMVSSRSRGFAAESEVLLKLDTTGIRMDNVPVATLYGAERSKIRPLNDTARFFKMLLKYLIRRGGSSSLRA